MAKSGICAPDSVRNFGDFDEVTGETLGTKRALHTTGLAGDPFLEQIRLSLLGYMPEPQYDTWTTTVTDADNRLYEFLLNGVRQFTITVTSASTLPVFSTESRQALAQENGDQLLLETGDELLKETP